MLSNPFSHLQVLTIMYFQAPPWVWPQYHLVPGVVCNPVNHGLLPSSNFKQGKWLLTLGPAVGLAPLWTWVLDHLWQRSELNSLDYRIINIMKIYTFHILKISDSGIIHTISYLNYVLAKIKAAALLWWARVCIVWQFWQLGFDLIWSTFSCGDK